MKPKLCNKLSTDSHNKAHNVRAWLSHRSEKAAGFPGQRYGAPDLDGSDQSTIAKNYPGAPDENFEWNTAMTSAALKEFEDEYNVDTESDNSESEDGMVGGDEVLTESHSDDEAAGSDWDEN